MVVFGDFLGCLLSYLFANSAHGWRILFSMGAAIALAQLVAMAQVPESPKWLMQNGRYEEARTVLIKIHDGDESAAGTLYAEMMESFKHSDVETSAPTGMITMKESGKLFSMYRIPLLVIITLMVLGQLSGSVVVRNYAPTIFVQAGFSENAALLFNVIVSALNLVIVCATSQYLDEYGRCTLLQWGFATNALGLLILFVGFAASSGGAGDHGSNLGVFILGCFLSSAGFNMGFGPVGWVLSSEMFPTEIRGRSMAISLVVRNIFEFLTNFMFLSSLQTIQASGTFFMFCLFSTIAGLFTKYAVVETKCIVPESILQSYYKNEFWRLLITLGLLSGPQENVSVAMQVNSGHGLLMQTVKSDECLLKGENGDDHG